MHVYLVRHGETFLAHRGVHQSPNTPLSPRGKEQAESVAEYLRAMNPSLVITSPYTRAMETARVIALHTGRETHVNHLFSEIVRPSSLYHKRMISWATLRYIVQSFLKRHDASWRYEDAENYQALCVRAQRARDHIESLATKQKSVVVVSHTVFINTLLAVLCEDRMPSAFEMAKMALGIMRLPHTGVVHLVYERKAPRSKTCAWRIVEA